MSKVYATWKSKPNNETSYPVYKCTIINGLYVKSMDCSRSLAAIKSFAVLINASQLLPFRLAFWLPTNLIEHHRGDLKILTSSTQNCKQKSWCLVFSVSSLPGVLWIALSRRGERCQRLFPKWSLHAKPDIHEGDGKGRCHMVKGDVTKSVIQKIYQTMAMKLSAICQIVAYI